jgi:hypothetical protein
MMLFEAMFDVSRFRYPVACSPQSWAAAAVFMMLPAFLADVKISGLTVGDARLDLQLERYGSDVGIHVLRREGDVEVVSVK